MFRPSLARLATHAPARTPSIRFPTKASRSAHLASTPTPHPAAPQAVIDAFPAFLQRLSATSAPASPSPSKIGSNKGVPDAEYEGEWDMPMRFRRSAYNPGQAEIDCVESGGATLAPPVTKASKAKWYTAQI